MKRNWKKWWKSYGLLWALLLCLTAGAITGTIYRNSIQEEDIKQVAQGIQTQTETEGQTEEQQEVDATVSEKDQNTQENSASAGSEEELYVEKQEDATPVSGNTWAEKLNFQSDSTMYWPVQGEVIQEYNMEETVYFPTLNQYRCSSAMMIQAEEGTPVTAPTKGIVEQVAENKEIGNYVVINLGNDYRITLGQLKDIQVSEGDQVQEGDLLAYVSEPSECYSVEGDNLYLQMTSGEEAVDPLDYLSY